MEHDLYEALQAIAIELRTLRENQEYDLVRKYPELQKQAKQTGGK